MRSPAASLPTSQHSISIMRARALAPDRRCQGRFGRGPSVHPGPGYEVINMSHCNYPPAEATAFLMHPNKRTRMHTHAHTHTHVNINKTGIEGIKNEIIMQKIRGDMRTKETDMPYHFSLVTHKGAIGQRYIMCLCACACVCVCLCTYV